MEVHRREGETTGAMLRRFTRRVQLSGILISARRHQFYAAAPTKRLIRERALRRIAKAKEVERLKKLGKLVEEPKR